VHKRKAETVQSDITLGRNYPSWDIVNLNMLQQGDEQLLFSILHNQQMNHMS